MTSRDLKIMFLKDTGKRMYNPDWIDDPDKFLEYIAWLEERIIALNDVLKTVSEVAKNTTKALRLLGDVDQTIL
jgi:hypothetical protein